MCCYSHLLINMMVTVQETSDYSNLCHLNIGDNSNIKGELHSWRLEKCAYFGVFVTVT